MADSKPEQKVWLISNDSATIEVGKFASSATAPASSCGPPRGQDEFLLAELLHMMLTETTADRVVAERSMLIKNMLEDVGDDSIRQDNPIPIPNVRWPRSHPSQSAR